MTPKELIKRIEEEKIEFVDLRFMDFPGLWQHVTYPASQLKEDSFELGFGFDGSCVRGWEAINETDMLLVPVVDTARIDPFAQHSTFSIICDVKDPVTKKNYSRDPRSVARKAADHLRATGVADQAMFGPEMEFFVFDQVRYDQTTNRGVYEVDSVEGIWNRGSDSPVNRGQQVRQREGYFPMPPMDTLADIRSEMATVLMRMGFTVEGHHHEVATGGQCEIDLRYSDMVTMADTCMYYKHVVKNVAAMHGKVATFMPKPLLGDNGSGMHTHFSLWKEGKPIMAGRHYAGLSQLGLYAIGGILKHARSLVAFTNPTTNSFKRLVPGYEAPVNLCYSSRNRSAFVRIPVYQDNPRTKRLELRCPDGASNPYLAFAAITMAAIDGIQNQIDPGDPVDQNIPDLPADEQAKMGRTPEHLGEALDALEQDHQYLLAGDVFSEEIVRFWIKYKRENELGELNRRPHPYEFCMYFDV